MLAVKTNRAAGFVSVPICCVVNGNRILENLPSAVDVEKQSIAPSNVKAKAGKWAIVSGAVQGTTQRAASGKRKSLPLPRILIHLRIFPSHRLANQIPILLR